MRNFRIPLVKVAGLTIGYREMLRKLNPELVLCFDTPFPEMEKDTVFIDYERFSKKEGKTMGGRGSDSRYVG
ncbi:hypothetical protein, partial [Sphaerochaeta sp.]|uniref:hypothetical protein n=1 Tax=Sphaerochaeta sp. TaxID=1972642 RepID=UPI002A36C1ED